MSQTDTFPFRLPPRRGSKPSDPESLFRSLSGRSPDVPHLWAHQADVLRKWHSDHVSTSDIALELPTGTGKTLIGLLIAEFVRQTKEHRVAYLCPNRQLAHQVGTLAHKYSIDVRVLVGKQVEYAPEDFNAFESSNAVAVTTYSAIFNTNPKIDSANLLILDDAHASADFISSLWSVDVDRNEHKDIYLGLLDLFADVIPSAQMWDLQSESPRSSRIESGKIPSPIAKGREEQLRDFLETELEHSDLRFPWSMIRSNLHACHIFISWPSISIRPLTPPTFSHLPFSSANQRIYMSATLGEGGELERITGVRKIERLPVTEGWEREGTGRRFILFPNWGLPLETAETATIELIGEPSRSLVLTPNRSTAQSVIDELNHLSPSPKIFSAHEIESSLEPFLNENHAALVLSNRYDGLDLPGDACHLEWICGLPGAVDAQEAFLLNRLGIQSLFRDRIRTRLTQALGRCTRNPTDYSLVIISGPEALDFCNRRENQSGFHPELQAEIQYGLNASNLTSDQEFKSAARAHLKREEGWEEVDEWIREERDSYPLLEDKVAKTLMENVKDEIDYAKAIWVGNHQLALERAKACADRLKHKDHSDYRAWWYYLAGSTVEHMLAINNSAHLSETAQELFARACSAAPTSTWFRETATRVANRSSDQFDDDPLLLLAAERIERRIHHIGVAGAGFDREAKTMIDQLDSIDAKTFEQGLERLGAWLGVEALRPTDKGVPDGVWVFADETVVTFEAKSMEHQERPISLNTARQARGHIKWVEHELQVPDATAIPAVIITDRTTVAKEALPSTQGLYVVDLPTIREFGRRIIALIRSIRAQASESDGEDFRRFIAESLNEKELDPSRILAMLQCNPLSEFLVVD